MSSLSSGSFNPSDPQINLRPPSPEQTKKSQEQKDAPDALGKKLIGPSSLKTLKDESQQPDMHLLPRESIKPTSDMEMTKGKQRQGIEKIEKQAKDDIKEKKEGFSSRLFSIFSSKSEKKEKVEGKVELTPKQIKNLGKSEIAKMGALIGEIPVQDLRYLKKSSLANLTNEQAAILGQKLKSVPFAEREHYLDLAKALLNRISGWPNSYGNTIKEMMGKKTLTNEDRFDLWGTISIDPSLDLNDPKWHLLALVTLPGLNEQCPLNASSRSLDFIFSNTFYCHQYETIDFFTKQLQIPIPEQMGFERFESMISGGTPGCKLPDCLKPYVNSISKEGETYLTGAVKQNSAVWVSQLKQEGANLDIRNKEGKTPLEIAASEQKYTLCRILEGDAFFPKEAERIAKMPVKDLKDYLWNAFLSSDSRDVHRVMDLAIHALESKNPIDGHASIQELKGIKQSFMNGGSIIARHPNFYAQRQMHTTYGQQYPNFRSQQIGFSEKREKAYQTVLANVRGDPNMSLDAILKQLSRMRGDFEASYREPGIKATTPMTGGTYTLGQVVALRECRENLFNPQSRDVSTNNEGYQIHLRVDENTVVPLTENQLIPTFISSRPLYIWNHTEGENLEKLFPHMEKQFQDIRKRANPNEPMTPEMKKDIAKLYWTVCQAMPFPRGSSQYALETRRLCLELCGYKASPPSQNFVFPDTVALDTPFDVFYAKYYDKVFDGEPQRIIK